MLQCPSHELSGSHKHSLLPAALPALTCQPHTSTSTEKEMKTQLFPLPKAKEEFIGQHGLKPRTLLAPLLFPAQVFLSVLPPPSSQHTEGRMSPEALNPLVFKPLKCPETAPVLHSPPAPLPNLHFALLCPSEGRGCPAARGHHGSGGSQPCPAQRSPRLLEGNHREELLGITPPVKHGQRAPPAAHCTSYSL